MPRGNGGVIGPANIPTTASAKGVWSLVEQMIAKSQGIWPPSVLPDPYFDYTTLLLPGNGTNGAQNNTFLDSSTNNFTITRNGNTTQGTFSPFSQTGWGNYFTNTSSGLYNATGSNTAIHPAASFLSAASGSRVGSIEAMVYITAYPTAPTTGEFSAIISIGATYVNFGINSGGELSFYYYTGSAAFTESTSVSSVPLNQWTYVAAIFDSSNNVKLYVNGTLLKTSTFNGAGYASGNNTFNQLRVGKTSSAATGVVKGYISNLRIVNGTAVTPVTPTTALTAITNTSLLTCQSNRFVDNSSNGYVLTVEGTPSVQAFSPFNPSASWSAATYGGSGYFDGSGDYLTTPSTTAVAFPGDWTIEMWYYPISLVANVGIWAFNDDKDNLDASSSGNGIAYYNGSAQTTFTGISLTALTWQHIAIVNSGGTVRAYINGVQSTNSASGVSTSSARLMYILSNRLGSNLLNAYVSSLRIVKGTAVYTGAFTPPSLAPLTTAGSTSAAAYPGTTNVNTSFASSATSLLLNYTNAGIYDATSKNDLETVGNAQISTAQSKWGGSSMYFDETGDYLTLPASQNVALGSGDFTIECWARFAASTVGNGMGLFQLSSGYLNSQVRGPAAGADNTTGRWSIYYGTSSTVHASLAPSTNTWYHVAFVRASGTSKLYVDGTEIISVSDSTNYTDTYFTVGGWYSSSFLLNGYLQDVRITKYARYTTNFTAPTAAFPTL